MSEELKAFWEQRAQAQNLAEQIARPVVLRRCGPVNGKAVLELGCGLGALSRELAHRGATVTAVDFSETNIQLAKTFAVPNLQFQCCDVLELDLGTKFDLVVGVFFLHEIPAAQFGTLIERLDAHLAPGGRIVFLENSFFNPVFRQIRRRLVDKGFLRKVGSFYETPFDEERFRMLSERFSLCERHVDEFVLFGRAFGQFLSHLPGFGWTFKCGLWIDKQIQSSRLSMRFRLSWSYNQTILAQR